MAFRYGIGGISKIISHEFPHPQTCRWRISVEATDFTKLSIRQTRLNWIMITGVASEGGYVLGCALGVMLSRVVEECFVRNIVLNCAFAEYVNIGASFGSSSNYRSSVSRLNAR